MWNGFSISFDKKQKIYSYYALSNFNDAQAQANAKCNIIEVFLYFYQAWN